MKSPILLCLRVAWLLNCFSAILCSALAEQPSTEQQIEFCPYGIVIAGFPVAAAQIGKYNQELGCRPKSIAFFLQWRRDWQAKDIADLSSSLLAIERNDSQPIIAWEPMIIEADGEQVVLLEDLTAGKFDGYLQKVGFSLEHIKGPVIIRLAHEMNLKRYHWGSAETDFGADSPKRYIKLFRYAVEALRSTKAGAKLRFAFNPNAESIPHPVYHDNAEFNTIAAYYPGDPWVDLVGLDGYNWGTTLVSGDWQSKWQTPEEIFTVPLRELRKAAPNKTVHIFETASVGTAAEKQTWLLQLLSFAKCENLRGVGWFQVNKENDWRLVGDK